jgi:hypothetical protein
MVPYRRNEENNICKRKKLKKCREKKEPTNLIHAAENLFTGFVSV